jgi:hypothetical protein
MEKNPDSQSHQWYILAHYPQKTKIPLDFPLFLQLYRVKEG